MKKICAILITLILAVSLAACGDSGKTPTGDNNAPSTSQEEQPQGFNNATATDIDFGSIMAGTGATDTVWGKQDADTKQVIVDAGKEDGLDVSFGSDGSMTIKDPKNGSMIVQTPDGTWMHKDEDGETQISGEWPDNEFTKLIPKPGFDLSLEGAGTGEDTFTVMFTNATFDQIRDYAKEVKSAGFSVDEDVYESGTAIYNYMAANADGYKIEVSFANGISSLSISKP